MDQSDDLVMAAFEALGALPGVVGVGCRAAAIAVYVQDAGVAIPAEWQGIPLVRVVTGPAVACADASEGEDVGNE